MRILLLNERDPRHPKAGGAETHVHEVFRRIAARGHAVTELVSAFADGPGRDEIDAIRFERVAPLPTYYPRAAFGCARATRRGEVDVVVECLNKLPFLAPLYSARPVLGLCHHLFGTTAFRQVAWPIAATVVAVERAIPRAYRRSPIVAISESTRADLIARGVAAGQVEVQVPGIRRPDARPEPIARRAPLVVYVGRLEAYKRIDLVLEAVAQLVARHPGVRLALLGRGAERSRLERRAAELGIHDRVEFAGFVSDDERDACLARARVCVCASHKEGFGLTVIEANAVGTPNVASDAPGLRDTVRDGETGFLVPGADPTRFADRIGALLGDDALAERMSQAALAWSQRFDWEVAADAMERSLVRASTFRGTPDVRRGAEGPGAQ
jgi:glycosyltransferase involved in cell wall biosynthesis